MPTGSLPVGFTDKIGDSNVPKASDDLVVHLLSCGQAQVLRQIFVCLSVELVKTYLVVV